MERACADCGARLPERSGPGARPVYCADCALGRKRAAQRRSAARPEYLVRAAELRRQRYRENAAYAEERKQAAHRYRLAHAEHVARKKREWAQANPGKTRESVRKFRANNPVIIAAQVAVQEAVKSGRLVPSACWCGHPTTEAHHHLGYDLDHWLEVVWLCRVHHREAHRKYPR
jgi:hypothetical protein